jgi:mRNA-degrading endonuclease toxin of MazEF toxin-antitoxin module
MTTRKERNLRRGLIVWATVPDAAGRNPKKRPMILLTSEDEVPPGAPLLGVGITGTLPVPLPPDHVPLPWHRARHPFTGLTKKCAACCSWIALVTVTDEVEVMGRVPDKEFADICLKVKTIQALQSGAKPEGSSSADPGTS